MLSELPGVGTLDGTAWGGVTRDNLVMRYDYLHRLDEVPLLTQLSVMHSALLSKYSVERSFYPSILNFPSL